MYTSNETGRYELYLRPFPAQGGRRYPVSDQGGLQPAWRQDGKELFYVSGSGRLIAVPIAFSGDDAQLGQSESLFPGFLTRPNFHRTYEVSPDGQRFLVAKPVENSGTGITVVTNWRRAMDK